MTWVAAFFRCGLIIDAIRGASTIIGWKSYPYCQSWLRVLNFAIILLTLNNIVYRHMANVDSPLWYHQMLSSILRSNFWRSTRTVVAWAWAWAHCVFITFVFYSNPFALLYALCTLADLSRSLAVNLSTHTLQCDDHRDETRLNYSPIESIARAFHGYLF